MCLSNQSERLRVFEIKRACLILQPKSDVRWGYDKDELSRERERFLAVEGVAEMYELTSLQPRPAWPGKSSHKGRQSCRLGSRFMRRE